MSDRPDIATQAEEVRAYVVSVRGGAPFLSAADGRLLVRWLESGISVARILAAVDEVAIKRRKKRARGLLTLSTCRRIVEGKKSRSPTQKLPNASSDHQLNDYVQALKAMSVSPSMREGLDRLIKAIELAARADNSEQMGMKAIAAIRAFHENAWDTAHNKQAEYRAQARDELGALSTVLSDDAFEAAVEEVARDIVRREYPLVSAAAVWDRLSVQ
jgi:hypothetical protein